MPNESQAKSFLYKGRNKIKTWAYLLDHLAWEWGKSLIYMGLSLMPASSQAKVLSVLLLPNKISYGRAGASTPTSMLPAQAIQP